MSMTILIMLLCVRGYARSWTFHGGGILCFFRKAVYHQQVRYKSDGKKNLMQNILIMGSGAVGGFYGGQLARIAGLNVTFVARGAHLRALQARGLRITGRTRLHLHPVHAVEDLSALDTAPDLVIVAVKSYDTPEAIRLLKPAVSTRTQILTIQNGLENYELLCDEFGSDRVIRGFCKIGAELTAPGVIDYRGLSSVVFGEEDGSQSNRVMQLQNIMERAGISVGVSREIRREAWLKFLWNGIFNMITGLTGATTDMIFDDEDAYAMAWQLFYEMQAVAGAEGVRITDKDGADVIEGTRAFGAFKTSTWQDRHKGKPLEYDAFCGYIVRKAAMYKLVAPVNQALFALYGLLEKSE